MTRLVQQTAQIVARSSHNLALFVVGLRHPGLTASVPNPTYIYFDISTKLAHDIPSIPGKRIISDFVLLDNYAGFHFVSYDFPENDSGAIKRNRRARNAQRLVGW
uniref:Uncharacterized protein n=1 Tax=Candidatus Kentrum sp. SD TaxID=2126332 RepID=A0A451BQS8_9GAMM|nr:MAG: hypothetical protein BECKSD772D_GA0070982_11299 [Candidatus Kentron sp. SD]